MFIPGILLLFNIGNWSTSVSKLTDHREYKYMSILMDVENKFDSFQHPFIINNIAKFGLKGDGDSRWG